VIIKGVMILMITGWVDKVIAGFMLIVIGAMLGLVWSHVQMKEYKKAMSNELKRAERKLTEMEDELNNREILAKVIKCESGGRHNIYGDGGKAFGIAQFHKATFLWLAEKSGMEGLKWKDKEAQIFLLKWALANGYANHWTCYKKLYGNKVEK